MNSGDGRAALLVSCSDVLEIVIFVRYVKVMDSVVQRHHNNALALISDMKLPP